MTRKPTTPAGYSGTPLPKKLGIKEGDRVGVTWAPAGLRSTLGPLPIGAHLEALSGRNYPIVLLFARTSSELGKDLPRAKRAIAVDGAIWLCWPKKTSPLARELTGDVVRESGLAAGLVDVKVCAIDNDWSGLKFMYRVRDRLKRSMKK